VLHELDKIMLPPSILVADDDQPSADLLHDLLAMDGHRVRCVNTRERALEVCASNPPDLIVLDLMAQGHGFEVCRVLKDREATRLIPIVIVTSQSDRRARLRGIEAGADDFLSKPFDPVELRARIRSLLRLKRYTDDLESAEAVILGLGATIEARDPSTQGHCQRLARYATGFGRALALSSRDLYALSRGGFLHDIGKIAVPDHVLLKGGALDPEETLVMRAHPVVGDTLCAGLRSLRDVRPIVRHHHEHLDGSGYPDGLREDAVPLLAQIVAIVDVFDAITTERPYRKALPHQTAFDLLEEESDKGWRDGALVREFIGIADTLL
jgi:putative two-component system response regulator